MQQTCTLADELGDLRALINTLKSREAELRARIIDRRPNAPLDGKRYRVNLRTSTRDRFDPAKLPDRVRHDRRYYSSKETLIVSAIPKETVTPHQKRK